MERLSRKERWEANRRRRLGAQSVWDSVRDNQVSQFRNMTPDELIHQSGQYDILSAQQVCYEKLTEARDAGDEAAVEAWQQVAAHLAERRAEYYERSQQPSRFQSWAARSQATRPVYNPRSRF